MRRIVNIVKFILTISYERHSSTTLRSRGKFCYIHKKGLRMFVVRWHREGRRGKWVSGGRWETVGGRFQKGFGFFFFFFQMWSRRLCCDAVGLVIGVSGLAQAAVGSHPTVPLFFPSFLFNPFFLHPLFLLYSFSSILSIIPLHYKKKKEKKKK